MTIVVAVSREKVTSVIGTAPSLFPRPNVTNIDALEKYLVDKQSGKRSPQSADLGYSGLIEATDIYALKSPNWKYRESPDPGAHHTIDAELNSAGQADAQVVWEAAKGNRLSDENLRAAVIAALNKAVPKVCRRVGGNTAGWGEYRPTDCPRQIIAGLRQLYGQPTPREREDMELRWAKHWNPGEPIEAYFDEKEDVYMEAVRHPPKSTIEQMIGKAITTIHTSRVMAPHLLKWNGFTPKNQNWANLRRHFVEAYAMLLAANQGVIRTPIGITGNSTLR